MAQRISVCVVCSRGLRRSDRGVQRGQRRRVGVRTMRDSLACLRRYRFNGVAALVSEEIEDIVLDLKQRAERSCNVL